MSIYRVIHTSYRGHDHGELFEATLPEAVEARALERGAIELVEQSTPGLEPGSYQLPRRTSQEGGRADAHPDPDQGRRRNSP